MRRNLILDEDIQSFMAIQREDTSSSDAVTKSCQIINRIRSLGQQHNRDESRQQRKSFSKFKLFHNDVSKTFKIQKFQSLNENHRQPQHTPINQVINKLYSNTPQQIQHEPKCQIKTSRSLKIQMGKNYRALPGTSLKNETDQNGKMNRRFAHNRRSSICQVMCQVKKGNKNQKSEGKRSEIYKNEKNAHYQSQSNQIDQLSKNQNNQMQQFDETPQIHIKSIKLNGRLNTDNSKKQTNEKKKTILFGNMNDERLENEQIKQVCQKQTNFQSNEFQRKNRNIINQIQQCRFCGYKKSNAQQQIIYKQFCKQISQKYKQLNQVYLQLRQQFQSYVFSMNLIFNKIKNHLNKQVQQLQHNFKNIQISKREKIIGKITKNLVKQQLTPLKKNIQSYKNQQQESIYKNTFKFKNADKFILNINLNKQLQQYHQIENVSKFKQDKQQNQKNEKTSQNLTPQTHKRQRCNSVQIKQSNSISSQKSECKTYRSHKSMDKANISFKNIQNALKNLKQFVQ